MAEEVAIRARDLRKTFRIFSERNQTLKQAILRRRRAVYEEFAAVDGVSFDVPKGSTFGIIGSNGSGKSTTLKVLAKIFEPDGGSVTVNGRISALLELGAGFHPELSGRENVFLNAAILGIPKKQVEKSFDDIVGFAELGRFIDNPVKTYSSGMYARLGFAVAVNVDPDVLLIDEVLAVGDEHFQRRCAEKIDDLRTDGRTVVIVSHGLGSIQSLCDEAIWIEKGHLRATGKPKDVIDEYVKSVHPDSVTDAQGGVHIGSGLVRIESVTVTGGVPLLTGDPARFIVHLNAQQRMEKSVVTISIRRIDGMKIGSASTDEGKEFGITIHPGPAQFQFSLPHLPMLPGTYEVDAQVTDQSRAHVFDRVTHAARFDVATDRGLIDTDGLIVLAGRWDI
jgi:ABC-2 type transport system ATP-binding protein